MDTVERNLSVFDCRVWVDEGEGRVEREVQVEEVIWRRDKTSVRIEVRGRGEEGGGDINGWGESWR